MLYSSPQGNDFILPALKRDQLNVAETEVTDLILMSLIIHKLCFHSKLSAKLSIHPIKTVKYIQNYVYMMYDVGSKVNGSKFDGVLDFSDFQLSCLHLEYALLLSDEK